MKKNNSKKLVKIIMSFIIVISAILLAVKVRAANPVDEITDYIVVVDVREDGTLDISYDFTWHVVEDDGEALTYVDFGIPNEHVDEIKSRSRESIDKIEFTDDYHNSDGAYVKILLKDEYYEGDYIHIAFSIHQSYMYRILDDEQQLRYNFTPGWFDEMKIQKLTIKWNADQVEEVSDDYDMEGSYYVWTKSDLDEGERYPITIYYDRDAYDVNENEQAEEDSLSWIIVIIVVGVIIIALVCVFSDGYSGGSGHGGGFFYSSCAHSSCAHSSCACACACAGGGRAGCSKKDFYKGSVDVKKLDKILSKHFWHKLFHK